MFLGRPTEEGAMSSQGLQIKYPVQSMININKIMNHSYIKHTVSQYSCETVQTDLN